MTYQYNYDADGNPVGVSIPINEWKIIASTLKEVGKSKPGVSKSQTLKKIKKGMAQVSQMEGKKVKSIPIQKLLDEL